MVDLMDEVAEEVRYERMLKMLKTYGPVAAIIAGGILAVTAGYLIWTNYQENQVKEVSTRYYQALKLPELDKKNKLASFEALSLENKEGYGVLSRFHVAQLQMKMEPTKVGDVFLNIATKTKSPQVIKHAAKMMRILSQFDDLTEKKAQEFVRDLESIQKESPAWNFLAKFLQAQLFFYLDQPKEAMDLLSLLATSPEVPEEVSSLSKAYIGAYRSGNLK